MTPKLAGIAGAMAKLHHSLDERAGKLLQRIESADKRSDDAFKKAHGRLDDAEKAVADVEAFIGQIEHANGGPTLDDSSGSSANHPQDSWAGNK